MSNPPICEVCELPATPGGIPGTDIGTVCPACEDARKGAKFDRYPPGGIAARIK